VVPDKVRDAVDVRMRAGRDGRETDGGDRGERGRPLDKRSCLVEKTERGQACLVKAVLEHRGREPIDDREDQALTSDGRQSLASTLSPAKRELARRLSRTPAIGAPTASA
jgi:hypothetical protein